MAVQRVARGGVKGKYVPFEGESEGLSTAQYDELSELMGTDKLAAIDLAAEIGGFDTSNVTKFAYDPKLKVRGKPADGSANRAGKVTLGKGAFRSPAWLVSTLGHEVEIHINQQLWGGNWARNPSSPHGIQNEIDAFNFELNNAGRFGLSKPEVSIIRNNRDLLIRAKRNARE
ncbi:MAG: hypothetical protein GXP16_01745 [Gammaproteobacteria bacterium]|nr:hypothetical protein [Gammaproteobacteria bacterium]